MKHLVLFSDARTTTMEHFPGDCCQRVKIETKWKKHSNIRIGDNKTWRKNE